MFTDVSDVLIASIIRVIALTEAINTSKTSVNFYEPAWSNAPEDRRLNSGRYEELKCHHD
jgi:hypothetical protein